ncbi:phosphatase PAP2 family protein [Enterovirga sp.]|uniref:phosphatase PAP2 family protein n=1 Tax=Enterovirga sp. TaxID=2026350 RepID=UPI00260FBA7B|nr:phosphatase PAP2 family protein [Enterovirga sp.]MDB5592494.1 phosphoesterase [Enterovirga sp.]
MELNRHQGWRALARNIPGRLRLDEAAPLVTLALVGLFGWGFIELAGEVTEGSTLAFDRRLLLLLRNPANLADPLGPGWLQESARDITGLGGHVILGLITLATIAYLLMTRRRGAALLVSASVGGGMIVSTLLKFGFERPRPDLVPHATQVYTASFPSGHAMLSAVVFLTLGALLARVHEPRRVKLFFLSLAVVLTMLVGCSRVYLGVHWPSDVLAGWCVGAGWASLCWYAALLLQRKGKVETEAPATSPAASAGPSGVPIR